MAKDIMSKIKGRLKKGKSKKSSKKTLKTPGEFLPLLVSDFDNLLSAGGIERGNSIMITGGSGTGKSTFCLQSLYYAAVKRGEKGLYITFEEEPESFKRHMKINFGWDFYELEKKGLIKFVKLDPFALSRQVESELAREKGELLIKVKGIENIIPRGFKPDRVVVDSLSALSAGFLDDQETYRLYLITFMKTLNKIGSINLFVGETEQEPIKYSRTGIEEFLVDGVIVLYNIRHRQTRQQALEILKMRCSDHLKRMIPYRIAPNKGFEIYIEGKIFF